MLVQSSSIGNIYRGRESVGGGRLAVVVVVLCMCVYYCVYYMMVLELMGKVEIRE